MEFEEFKAFLQDSKNALPLNYVLFDVKKISNNEPVKRSKTVPVTQLNTQYIILPFYKAISKLIAYEVPKV